MLSARECSVSECPATEWCAHSAAIDWQVKGYASQLSAHDAHVLRLVSRGGPDVEVRSVALAQWRVRIHTASLNQCGGLPFTARAGCQLPRA